MPDCPRLVTIPPARHNSSSLIAKGFSLVELMVALAISLLLVAAVLQFFAGTKMTYTATEAIARAQESGRFALETLKPVVRTAGLSGICGGGAPPLRNHLDVSDAEALALLGPDQAIRGWEYRNTGTDQTITLDDLEPGSSPASNWLAGGNIGNLPEAIADLALPFSDILLIREMRPVGNITARQNNAPDQENININYGTGADQFKQCEIVLVTNCNQADLFQNTDDTSAALARGSGGGCDPGNEVLDWSAAYRSATQFYRPISRVFFIGEGTSGEPALFTATFGLGLTNPVVQEAQELVDGIENMQILYGYSEPGPPDGSGDGQSVDVFLPAQFVPNWEYVIAVRIGLLARSPGAVGMEAVAETYDVGLTNVTHTADRVLRQPYNVTLALRNRQIVR